MSATPTRETAQVPLEGHMDGSVQLLKDGTLRIIQLNRPKVLNALNEEMIDAFGKALDVSPSFTDPGD